MIQYLFLGLLALALALIGAGFYTLADPRQLALWSRRGGGLVAAAAAGWLAVSGLVLVAVPLAFLAFVLLTQRTPLGGSATATAGSGRSSSVRTAFLEMMLDHDSGTMRGTVLAGVYAGRDLAALAEPDLIVLWRECRAGEAQSRQLLEAYLDRRWPEWREELRRREADSAQAAGGPQGGPMSEDEARQVLGLPKGAGAEAIRTAHRNLMKRLHPDQGGSTYLAAKINEAKDVLLKSARG